MSSLSTHHCVLAEDFANTKTAFSLCLASSLTFWVSVLRVLDSDRPPTSLPCPSPGLRSTPCQRRVRSALPPHRNEKIVGPHQPSSSSQLSSQSISDCPSDSDGRQRLQAYLYAAPPWRHEEDAHRSWGRADIWLLSCRRTAAATPTTQPAPHPRRSRLMLWTRRRAGGFQHKDERRPTK